MMALYNAHSPDKTSEVDKLLAKYEGKEEAMWSKLKEKYGETAIEEATAAAKLSSSTDLRAVDPDRTFAESMQKMESHSREKDSKILEKASADNTPEGEAIANMRLHERELMSKDLTKAHEEYDKRDHHTVAQDVGHLGADTVASAHHHDKATADNVPEAEYINSHNVHAREEASALLAQEHEKHSKRKKHTVPQDMGHVTTGVSLLVPLIIFDVHQHDTLHCSGG